MIRLNRRFIRPALLATLAGGAVLALGTAALSQESAAKPATQAQAQDRFEGEVNVNEVLLDVLVTDRKGNVIVGLDKNDFVVKEDGKPVFLTGVTFYSNRRFLESKEAVAQKGLDVDRTPSDRFFILFFEDQKGNGLDAPRLLTQQLVAGREARDWVKKDLQGGDYVAVVSYDKKLEVQQDFTQDRKALIAAIDDAIKGKDPGNNWPSRTPGSGPSLLAGLPRGNDLRDKTPTIYEALQVLADASGKVTGRKNLMLFTIGFGRIDELGQYSPDPRYYPPTMRALNASNVAVYPIDLWPAGTIHPLANAMSQLALETGGQYYFNFTNFATPLNQVAQENSGYYLLSYSATHPSDKTGFQKVVVDTANPEFKVRAREGYTYGGKG